MSHPNQPGAGPLRWLARRLALPWWSPTRQAKVDKTLDVQPVWSWEGVTTDPVGVTPRKVNDRFNQTES